MHSKRNTLKFFFSASISSRQETLFDKHGDVDIYIYKTYIYTYTDVEVIRFQTMAF